MEKVEGQTYFGGKRCSALCWDAIKHSLTLNACSWLFVKWQMDIVTLVFVWYSFFSNGQITFFLVHMNSARRDSILRPKSSGILPFSLMGYLRITIQINLMFSVTMICMKYPLHDYFKDICGGYDLLRGRKAFSEKTTHSCLRSFLLGERSDKAPLILTQPAIPGYSCLKRMMNFSGQSKL